MSRTPLNAFCALTMGQSPDSESYNIEHNGFPFYQGNADFGRIHPMVRVWCSAPKKLAKAGDILISVRAPIGALNIADCDCCIGRGLAAITPDATCVDTMFLFMHCTRVQQSCKDEAREVHSRRSAKMRCQIYSCQVIVWRSKRKSVLYYSKSITLSPFASGRRRNWMSSSKLASSRCLGILCGIQNIGRRLLF